MSLFARGPKLSLPTFLPARPLRFTDLGPTAACAPVNPTQAKEGA
jgi:hypothetical protein